MAEAALNPAERSLRHWSEDGRAGMEAFYALAAADYGHLAAAQDWRGWMEAAQAEAGDRPLRLLDVACGSGKFPAALVESGALAGAALQPVDYHLLDPSAFSLAEARAALRPPFAPGAAHHCALEDAGAIGPFDVVWATHALYAVPAAALPAAMARFVALTAGRGFIAHATADSFYLRFDRAFAQAFRGGRGEAYNDADAVARALRAAGARFETRDIAYVQRVEDAREAVVEGFLRRCAFDDGPTLAQMRATEPLAGLLETCRDDAGWAFAQRVRLFFLTA